MRMSVHNNSKVEVAASVRHPGITLADIVHIRLVLHWRASTSGNLAVEHTKRRYMPFNRPRAVEHFLVDCLCRAHRRSYYGVPGVVQPGTCAPGSGESSRVRPEADPTEGARRR